jgi:hypothetical protein
MLVHIMSYLNIQNYTTIIFTRNPYNRLISGFREKYHPKSGTLIKRWKHKKLLFSNFVYELVKNEFKMIETSFYSSNIGKF